MSTGLKEIEPSVYNLHKNALFPDTTDALEHLPHIWKVTQTKRQQMVSQGWSQHLAKSLVTGQVSTTSEMEQKYPQENQ